MTVETLDTSSLEYQVTAAVLKGTYRAVRADVFLTLQ